MTPTEILTRHPFTSGLDSTQRTALEPLARVETFAPGAIIFREGGPADTLYLLEHGRVSLDQHVRGQGNLQLESVTAGDILGLSWAMPNARWLLTARAVEPCETLALDAPRLLSLMDAQPALGFRLAFGLVREVYLRLERTRLQRLDVYRAHP